MSQKNRTQRKRFITLNFKLAIVVVFALIMTFIVFEILGWVQAFVAQRYYLSDEAVARNVESAYQDLTTYIARNQTKSTDIDQLQKWVRDQEYTYLVVSDNYSVSFDGGWSVTTNASDTNDVTEDQSDIEFDNEQDRITPDTFEQDVKNRIVEFSDGPYYVYINVYREEYFYRVMMFARIILCVITLIGIVLIYNSRVLSRISRLSAEVEEVTSGNLTAGIQSTANDEIGSLANNVDTMRDYIIRRLQSEKEAWDKNSELITAMSHDIRTPLTSLIGYLDIIESEKYQSKEDEKKYIEACREKAFQLKDLSDKMFQYFLVFGSQAAEKNLEVFDAGILLQQIISEHSAELINYGFNIDFEYTVPEEVEIETDISGLRRLFDNLFSNIMKYADKTTVLRISAVLDQEEKNIIIRMMNGVLTESRRVESNKIGLKTCDKICKDMGGTFSYEDEGQVFTVRMTLPVYEEKPKPQESSAEDLGGIDIHDIDIHNMEEVLGTELIGEPQNQEGPGGLQEGVQIKMDLNQPAG